MSRFAPLQFRACRSEENRWEPTILCKAVRRERLSKKRGPCPTNLCRELCRKLCRLPQPGEASTTQVGQRAKRCNTDRDEKEHPLTRRGKRLHENGVHPQIAQIPADSEQRRTDFLLRTRRSSLLLRADIRDPASCVICSFLSYHS